MAVSNVPECIDLASRGPFYNEKENLRIQLTRQWICLPFTARDLTRLLRQIEAWRDEKTLWRILPGVTISAGNLVLHIEGNREYIGRQLGGIPYTRQREREFTKDLRKAPAFRHGDIRRFAAEPRLLVSCIRQRGPHKSNNHVVYACKYHAVWRPKYRRSCW
jgi:hypothetical protein